MHRCWLAVLLLALMAAIGCGSHVESPQAGTEFVIDDRAAIVWWSPMPSPVPAFAASELQSYLERISGKKLPVYAGRLRAGDTAPTLPGAVVLLAGAHAGELSASWLNDAAAMLSGKQDDSFVLAGDRDRIVMTGGHPRSTLYAVYDLLERAGARFFAPSYPFYRTREGDFSEAIIRQDPLRIPTLHVLEQPSFRYRRKHVEEGWSHTHETMRELVDWMAKNKLNTLVVPYDYGGMGLVRWDAWRNDLTPELEKRGILLEVGGHGYTSWIPPTTYPGYYENGYNVFKVSNPAGLAEYEKNVVAYLKSHPEIAIFDAWPPDNARWTPADVEAFGSVSNAQAHVARHLGDALKKETPAVRLESLAYLPATDPPSPASMYEATSLVDFAPYDRSYAEPLSGTAYPRNVYYDGLVRRWADAGFKGDISIYEYYRKYSWHSLPVVLPTIIGGDIPHYRTLGATGLGTYSEPADWITYELNHRLVAALSWNTALDVKAYLNDHVVRRFGAALAPDMMAYFRDVETAGRDLYTGPNAAFGDTPRFLDARAKYLAVEKLLTSVRDRTGPTGTAAGLLIDRLAIHAHFASLDMDIAYFTRVQPDAPKVAAAHAEMARFVDEHMFDGIVLKCTYLQLRYLTSPPPADDEQAIRAAYRAKWP
ncbi:DUF4838 domain-containing protein [Pendulispora brunnea]|uniref:DUF4838 domain-containing protein n=1 Tax=Pendulispora brunnea TaxID=2905690 RepID=A0ABZ2K8E5_9BACT